MFPRAAAARRVKERPSNLYAQSRQPRCRGALLHSPGAPKQERL
jgi:hypothetical protein